MTIKRFSFGLLAAAVLLLTVPALAAAGTISGKVFYHPPSGPDVPIPNVSIAIKTVVDAPVTTTTTAADGTYSAAVFGGASGTTYHVYVSNLWQFISPAGGEIDTVVTGSATTSNVNFSVKGVSFAGTIFNDFDGDAVHDGGETTGVSGAKLTVTGPATTTATTDQFGGFITVPILPAGQYTLTPSKSGYVATSTPIKTGSAGQVVSGGYVGLHFPTGTVEGRAYVETNGIAGKQADERPISGAAVTVTGTADGQPFSFPGTTDQDGNFQITAYAGASRVVSVAQPAAYADGPDTTSVAGAVAGPDKFTFTLAENTTAGPFQFGETGATISGVAFLDRDGDGVRDAGEQPSSGRLIDVTGTLGFAATATSGQDGAWTVAGLPAGNVTVAPQSVTDSLAPVPLSLSPTAGQVVTGQDLAYRLASLSGTVVDKTTGQGVGGVTVKLAGPAPASAVTAADGSFHFYDLTPGTYAVSATVPSGYDAATSAVGSLGGSAGSASVAGIPIAAGDAGTSYVLRVATPLGDGGGTTSGAGGGGTGGGGGGAGATGGSTGGGSAGGTHGATKVTVVAGSRLKLRKRAFKLGCRLDAGALRSCVFTVRNSKGKVIAKGTAKASSGGLALTTSVRLTKLGRKLRGKRVSIIASVVATDATGKRFSASRKLRLALR